MPQLLRLRLVSVGHRAARMDDLTLDFRDPQGRAADSTIWLRNGGGKSSILNLLFAIMRPHRNEFLGGQSDAKQRSLDDYILAGDRSVTAAEWSLDAAADTLGFEGERLITGVFYERRDAGGELRRMFFSARVSPSHPESTLDGLPVNVAAGDGGRRRVTLTGFREAWLNLRDRAPHLGVSATEHQREWQEILDAARIDPELFSYQVRMNRREGGVDELFRFASAEDFADFLLEMALEPTLAGNVSRNIAAWRGELVRRREQLQPERELVARMLDRLSGLREVSEARSRLCGELRQVRGEISRLARLVDRRRSELTAQAADAEAEETRCAGAAAAGRQAAAGQRARAAGLRRHAARLRLGQYQEELRGLDEQLREQRRLAKVWAAAEPLRRALRLEQSAGAYRRRLEERQKEHAPLRVELGAAAGRLAAALAYVAGDLRQEASQARQDGAAARTQAREYRKQAAAEQANVRMAEARAVELRRKLAQAETRASQLAARGYLETGEGGEAGLERWAGALQAREEAIGETQVQIERVSEALESLERGIQAALEAHADVRALVQALETRWREAAAAREAIETDATLRATLELEGIDADRLAAEALDTLDRAARDEQRTVVSTRLTAVQDEQALDHLGEWGLLPPAADVRMALEVLRGRLGGQAWSGWEWLEANVPPGERAELARRAPYLAQGVVVRAGDIEMAVAALREAGVLPEGPLAVTVAGGGSAPMGVGAGSRWPALPAVVLGPGEAALFDRQAGQAKIRQLQERVAEVQNLIRAAEAKHRELVRARQALGGFRDRYRVGWFAQTAEELAQARRDDAAQAGRLDRLRSDRQAKLAERKGLEEQRNRLEREAREAQAAVQALEGFVADYVKPAAGWRRELAAARDQARGAAAEAEQWEALADEAEEGAETLAGLAQERGEAASRYEEELRRVSYLEGPAEPRRGPLDQLRTGYEMLRSSYEQRVGADQLAALAQQNEEHAKEQRRRLARLLSEDVTEVVVQGHLDDLANPDEIDSLREQAESTAGSLFGSLGRLNQRVQAEQDAVRQAERLCAELGVGEDLDRAPGAPHLAEGEANQLEDAARAAEAGAQESEAAAAQARERARALRDWADGLERLADRLTGLNVDYDDLFVGLPESEAPPAAAGAIEGSAPETPGPALDELAVGQFVRRAAGELRQAREVWNKLNSRRHELAAGVRTVAGGISGAVRQQVQWVERILAHPDPELEDASARLAEQLALRRQTLDDQLVEIDKHRDVLATELMAVAEDGLRLLKQASSLSRLPEGIAGIGGAQFLRISTDEPEQGEERRARLAQLVDELARGDRELDGIKLAQAAVRRLARRIQVRVMHPDPALQRHSVSIPEMARFSGGEQLTGAILLYCTLANVRGRARGQSRRPSSVLVLDNPIGRVSRPQFLRLQRDVARAMGIQLIYTTAVNDHEALSALPNIIRLRNDRVDRNSGRRLVEYEEADDRDGESGALQAVRVGRRELAAGRAHAQDAAGMFGDGEAAAGEAAASSEPGRGGADERDPA